MQQLLRSHRFAHLGYRKCVGIFFLSFPSSFQKFIYFLAIVIFILVAFAKQADDCVHLLNFFFFFALNQSYLFLSFLSVQSYFLSAPNKRKMTKGKKRQNMFYKYASIKIRNIKKIIKIFLKSLNIDLKMKLCSPKEVMYLHF